MWRYIVRCLFEFGYASAVTYAIGKWSISYAYLERGYEAVGGEVLILPAVWWVAYKLVHHFCNILEAEKHAEKRKKIRSRRAAWLRHHR